MLFLVASVTANAKNGYPEFSWDRVPVALHLGEPERDFTQEETEFIARFPLVCFEKSQGVGEHKDSAKGAFVATEAVKKINPDAKILFYWNSWVDWGKFSKYQKRYTELHPEWTLLGNDGEPFVFPGDRWMFDQSREDLHTWWIDAVEDAVENHDMDGVFVDGIHQFYKRTDLLPRLGEERLQELRDGAEALMRKLRERLGKNKIILSNNIHPTQDYGTSITDYSNAGMFEHYCWRDNEDADEFARQIELVQQCAKEGRIMMVKGWPRHHFNNPGTTAGFTDEQILENMKEDIVFPLACFLVGAGKYSYFCYSWGWDANTGWLVDFPEYNKPLGKPLGDAKREGYIFTRQFKYADVWVDVENRKAKIDWKE